MTTPEKNVVGFQQAMELLRLRHIKPKDDKKYPYRLVPFEELKPGSKSPYLVDGVIPQLGLVAVWGPPKCGKSFWTFDLAMHVALRRTYRGRRVNGGPVAYLAFEGAAGFGARAEAFRRTHEITGNVPFWLLATNAKLVRDHPALIKSIDGQMDDPPMVIVLDTLNRSIDGSENKDLDMGAYLAAAETMVQEFDCVVIVVHHCGVDGSRPRGHTSLTGAVDVQIAVKRDTAGNILAQVEAMKDGAEGASFASSLKVVEVGIDDEGKPLTSCVIEPVEAAPASAKSSRKPSDRQVLALRALTEVTLSQGRDPPPEYCLPADIKVVAAEAWREEMLRCNALDRKAANPWARFGELRNGLAARNLIGSKDDFVWAVRPC